MDCPLCTGDERRILGTLDVRHALREMSISLPLGLAVDSDADTVDLIECRACGLQYFSPSVVGTAALYENLATGSYYRPLRWDQLLVLSTVNSDDRVVDLGCGNGSFVEAAVDRGAHATGVDFSVAAGLTGVGQGQYINARADLHADAVDKILAAVGPSDLVTAFQLVEHLSDPVSFVRAAATLLVDGGRLVISVPNRDRFAIDSIQALDCPPHHQTRWTSDQLRLLGQRSGLVVVNVVAQRTMNPAKLLHRLVRRLARRHPKSWPLPAIARPWPPSHVLNGMSLVATYSTTSAND